MRTLPDKYSLYQAAVQSPAHDARLYRKFFRKLRGPGAADPHSLREDFCGTFVLSCEWVKLDPANTAIGLDLDPEPLAYGVANAYSSLRPEQRSRITLMERDVISVTRPARDLIVAGNFSFFIFQERARLREYFRACRRSLQAGRGVLMLDMVGGSEMVELGAEETSIRNDRLGRFKYIWDTRDFDPISHRVNYAIHFELPGGRRVRNAFTYDWRLWSIPEVREILAEAGFRDSAVIWDVAPDDQAERHVVAKRARPAACWIAYVAGLA